MLARSRVATVALRYGQDCQVGIIQRPTSRQLLQRHLQELPCTLQISSKLGLRVLQRAKSTASAAAAHARQLPGQHVLKRQGSFSVTCHRNIIADNA